MVISVYRRGNNTCHIRPAQHRLTLLVDGGDRRAFAPLDQTLGSILQFLAQGAQFRPGLGDVIV